MNKNVIMCDSPGVKDTPKFNWYLIPGTIIGCVVFLGGFSLFNTAKRPITTIPEFIGVSLIVCQLAIPLGICGSNPDTYTMKRRECQK